MAVFSRFIGTTNFPLKGEEKYFALYDEDDSYDIAIVKQDEAGGVDYVCGCCVWVHYKGAIPLLQEANRKHNKDDCDVQGKSGGNIDSFVKDQISRSAHLKSYYQKRAEFEMAPIKLAESKRWQLHWQVELQSRKEYLEDLQRVYSEKISVARDKVSFHNNEREKNQKILDEGNPKAPKVNTVNLLCLDPKAKL